MESWAFKYFFEGLLLGCAYAMPIGVQNIFVIHSAVTQKLRVSYLAALFVSIVDISLSVACFYGVGLIVEKVPVMRICLFVAGATFLFYYGYKLLLSDAQISLEERAITLSKWEIARKAFILTWFNPQALLDGSILFGSYRSSLPREVLFPFLAGVILASPLWFFTLTSMIGRVKAIFSGRVFTGINRACGIILIIFAIKLFSSFIRGLS